MVAAIPGAERLILALLPKASPTLLCRRLFSGFVNEVEVGTVPIPSGSGADFRAGIEVPSRDPRSR